MIQKPKGTYDVYGLQGRSILYLENLMKALMEKYHYQYIRTPLFEATELFHRGVGEATDIVTKETYDFLDRGNRAMTLRPEGTAGVVRSLIENKLYGDPSQPVKTWYYGPMYRYERPQSGRFREFYQFGVEVFGSLDPFSDAEVISIPVNFYRLLGLKGITVGINTLGDTASRASYHKALTDYFAPHLSTLCEDCQTRFSKNPLRILDCKIDAEKEIMKNAPKMIDYLNEESKTYFEQVKEALAALEIPFSVDPTIVRGLDYYTHTVFEVKADVPGFGSQNVLCGGGRYDHLVEQIGGPVTPGVGFALGMERLLGALALENITLGEKDHTDLYVVPLEPQYKKACFALTQMIRLNGFIAEMDLMNRNLKGNFKQADRSFAKFILLYGENEEKEGYYTLKNNETKEEEQIDQDYLISYLEEHLEETEDTHE